MLVRAVVRARTVLVAAAVLVPSTVAMLVPMLSTRESRVLGGREARLVVHGAVTQLSRHRLQSGAGGGE